MRLGTLLLLVVLAGIAGYAGWSYGPSERGTTQTVAGGAVAFPGLGDKLTGAGRIELTHQDLTLGLTRHDDVWGLDNRAGYPVQADLAHGLLAALAELRLTEPRTSDPAEYARLGVEDPTGKAATGVLVRVRDGAGAVLAELIVGHQRVRTRGGLPDAVYVRRPGEAQSWLAEGRLDASTDIQRWIARDIVAIDHAKIVSVTVTRDGRTLKFAQKDGKFDLTEPADHPKLESYKVEDVGRALENLTLTDVKPAAQVPADAFATSVFTTSDGLSLTVALAKADKDLWARFTVAGDTADAKALAARLSGWAYQLPSWKEQGLAPRIDDIKAAEPAPVRTSPPPTQ